MRIAAAPVMQVMPVAGKGEASGPGADFGAMLAEAGGESGEGIAEDATVAVDPAVVVIAAAPVVAILAPAPVPALAVSVLPVTQILPPPTGGRAGEGGDGLTVPPPERDGGAVPTISVPTTPNAFDRVVASRSPSPRPSPRGGEGALVAPVIDVASARDGAPVEAMLRDVSALPAAQPGVVTVLPVVLPVAQALPSPTGGTAGAGGDGPVVPVPLRDDGAVSTVSVPVAPGAFDMVISGRGPSPRPAPRGGEGAFVAPVADVAAAPDVAPAGAMMRDVTALLAAQPVPVAIVAPVASPVAPAAVQAVTPPPVGVAEAAIREQVAAMVARDDVPDRDADTPADPVALPVVVAGMPVMPSMPTMGVDPVVPVLSADGALGLHVAAAQAGQELDGIARDIAATDGSGDAPMRFRLDPAALGPVMVEVARGLDGLAVRIEARDGTARDVIADQQPRLVTDARAAGVQIATVQVEARRDDPATAASSYQQATGQQPQSSSGQSGQRPQPPMPAPTAGWTRPAARGADTGPGPRAASELYA